MMIQNYLMRRKTNRHGYENSEFYHKIMFNIKWYIIIIQRKNLSLYSITLA